MDSITKGQRNLLLFILGIAILVVPIRFFAMDNFGAKKDLESQKNERQTYYNELKAKDANRQQYIEDTEKYTKQYQEVIAKFLQNSIRTIQSCISRELRISISSTSQVLPWARRHFSIHLVQVLQGT